MAPSETTRGCTRSGTSPFRKPPVDVLSEVQLSLLASLQGKNPDRDRGDHSPFTLDLSLLLPSPVTNDPQALTMKFILHLWLYTTTIYCSTTKHGSDSKHLANREMSPALESFHSGEWNKLKK